MNRRDLFAAVVPAAAGFATLAAVGPAVAQEKKDDHHAHFTKCARACADCQLQCDTCFSHCKDLLAQGKKEHEKTTQLCVDCADCCKLAATLTARMSPLSAEACEKFKDDKHMADCAKSCRDCAKACREMIQHLKH